MLHGRPDFRTTVITTALVVALALAVPLVVTAASAHEPAASAAPNPTLVQAAPAPSEQRADDPSALTVESPASASPKHDQADAEPSPLIAPPSSGSGAQVEPAAVAAAETVPASAPVSSRPAAAAPAKPLTAQPAPVVPSSPVGVCPAPITGASGEAPSHTSPLGVGGTTTADVRAFAEQFNSIRVANCLPPVPLANIRYDACMEDRLFWIAEDPSTDTLSAWGHIGSIRSDGVPSVGCDGNLSGGLDHTGATAAQRWWESAGHRTSLYKPTFTGSTATVCIFFAMTHGGVPDEPASFTRAAARWVTC